MASPVESRRPELRKDSVTNRWVIFSPARAKRPSDFKSKSPAPSSTDSPQTCPFCIGQEHHCAPEIFRFPPQNPDWKVRVIQNLYPALSRDKDLDSSTSLSSGSLLWGCLLDGYGFHDVIIESPVHSVHLSDLTPEDVAQVLFAYKKRILQLASDDSIKYVQVFKNHGASAGASMTHSHSQMVGLPVIPPSVTTRLDSMKQYFNETGKCSICHVPTKDLLVDESVHFISVVPYAASFPFELWIVPRDHVSHFHELDQEKCRLLILEGY
ncbi:probable galactose-1-phosphate uridyltransferase isoform X3 [Cucumis melo]|uniref:Probable galactose-1-phosphate uridyltransferase isoform X3 n=1 Tax=Cucumis melo TaxID=3656 RepID=A0ABM3KUH0_CUCME|nr:probable galactose-1-phosphate uridyltransferase isoform X3 [Cucumis melo]XP_050941440.1 probable galactose-1-phosphate uridyltransferase isoform X3 [Cucumis melo]